jgi:hypothetical protein
MEPDTTRGKSRPAGEIMATKGTTIRVASYPRKSPLNERSGENCSTTVQERGYRVLLPTGARTSQPAPLLSRQRHPLG